MALALAPLAAQAPPERKLQVTFDQQGNVTVVAQNVTVGEILAEWGRQGGTTMVNANRLTGAPMSRLYHESARGRSHRVAAPPGGRLHRHAPA